MKPLSIIKKIGVLLLGIPIIILGIILLPLPGPGLVVIAFGLFVISLEFESARKLLDKAKKELSRILSKAKAKIQDKNKNRSDDDKTAN